MFNETRTRFSASAEEEFDSAVIGDELADEEEPNSSAADPGVDSSMTDFLGEIQRLRWSWRRAHKQKTASGWTLVGKAISPSIGQA
jgi:hypothetical protein